MAFAYRIQDQQACYFLTFTVVQWIDIFTRRAYAEMVIDSLQFCQQEKGLILYGWVIMSNHIHLVARCKPGHTMSGFIRDFKKFTAKKIVAAIDANPQESRKNWLLWLFRQNGVISFWQDDNHAEEIFSKKFFYQKLHYLHENPVRAGYVYKAADWVWSSAGSNVLVLEDWYGD